MRLPFSLPLHYAPIHMGSFYRERGIIKLFRYKTKVYTHVHDFTKCVCKFFLCPNKVQTLALGMTKRKQTKGDIVKWLIRRNRPHPSILNKIFFLIILIFGLKVGGKLFFLGGGQSVFLCLRFKSWFISYSVHVQVGNYKMLYSEINAKFIKML